MHRGNRTVLPVALLVVAAACSAQPGRTTERANFNLITSAEMSEARHADAFSLVQSLRPQWLRVRGSASFATREVVRVYLDGLLLGGPEQLRQIATSSVSTLQYFDGLQASQRWGLDHGGGAILASTR